MDTRKTRKTQPPPPTSITVVITTREGNAKKTQRIKWDGLFEVLIQPITGRAA